VVYEYANHLSKRGHAVTLIHPALNRKNAGLSQISRSATSFIYRRVSGTYRPTHWFRLDPSVAVRWVPTLSASFVPDGDIVVATAWNTAEWITKYPASKGRRVYLIQSWEIWDGPEDRVRATWKAPLTRIVVARWLRQLGADMGLPCIFIPNGIDLNQFGLDVPIEARDPNEVMMLYHSHPVKGSADGLAALELVHRTLPDLRATLFGTSTPDRRFPSWVKYYRLPSQKELRALYNRAAVFVSPAGMEGWPLPPAEAMICGAALVATDIAGHREYASHGETALLSPPGNPGLLAENILRFVKDTSLRLAVAKNGNTFVRKFSWERAADLLEGVLRSPDASLERSSRAYVVPSQIQDPTW